MAKIITDEERVNDPIESIRTAFLGLMKGMYSALPGYIVDFNASEQTATVQPTVMSEYKDADGNKQVLRWPTLPRVPVAIYGDTKFCICPPSDSLVNAEVMIVFSTRNIDAWFETGAIQNQNQIEKRMFDPSDGIAFLSPRSLPNSIPSYPTENLQIRLKDGSSFVELTPAGDVNITAGTVTITGDAVITGTVVHSGTSFTSDAATFENNGINIGSTHVHGSVTVGPNVTAVPQ